jgi:hypothetical protein
MILLRVLSLLFGLGLMLAILGSALKTVVLPQEGFTRLGQAVFAAVYRLLVHRRQTDAGVRALKALYAPVSLVTLPLIWMVVMAIAFTCIFWGTGSLSWQKAFEISGSSLTTLGFAEPDTTARIWVAFIEAVIGLGLVALLISYLPTIFSAYNGRERGITTLRPVAGVPPTAVDLLQNLHRVGLLNNLDFWRNESDWMLDIEQTHTAFPTLTFFPETNIEHSWVASVGTLLDAAALISSASETLAGDVFDEDEKGPLMVLVYGLPGITRVARAANVPLPPPVRLPDLVAHYGEPAPPISIERAEYLEAMASLAAILVLDEDRQEAGWRRFAWTRSAYDQPLRALAGLTKASAAPWSTDRPALVGSPRFLRRRPLRVDWTANLVRTPATGG